MLNIFLWTDHLKMSWQCNLTMHSKHVFFKSSSKSVSQGMCLIFSCWCFSPFKNVVEDVTHLRYFFLAWVFVTLAVPDWFRTPQSFSSEGLCSSIKYAANTAEFVKWVPCLHTCIHIPELWITSPPMECNCFILLACMRACLLCMSIFF